MFLIIVLIIAMTYSLTMPTYKLTQIPVAIQINLVIYFQLYGTEEKIDTQKGSVTCLRSPDCMWQYGIGSLASVVNVGSLASVPLLLSTMLCCFLLNTKQSPSTYVLNESSYPFPQFMFISQVSLTPSAVFLGLLIYI